MIRKLVNILGKETEWPTGMATLSIFVICLACYYLMSPFYGVFIRPDAMMTGPENSINWLAWAIQMGFLGGFWHGNLQHLMYNMVATIPCMLVVEKYRGPVAVIMLYCLMSIVGSIFLCHMVGAVGIGSSCATFGFFFVAAYLLTSGLSRLVLFVPLIVAACEAAKWWFGALGDPVGHLAHLGGIVVGILYCLMIKDK